MAERSYRLIVEGEFSDIVGLTFPRHDADARRRRHLANGRVRDQSELLGRASHLVLVLLEPRATDDHSNPGLELDPLMRVPHTGSHDDRRT